MNGATELAVASLFSDRGHVRQLEAGEVLFREADRSTSVFECLEGRIRLAVSARGGRELLLDIAVPGDVFGELSAIDNGTRSTSAAAMGPSTVVELSASDFLAAVRADPGIAITVLRGLARQLRQADRRICSGETDTVATRTALLLLELAERWSPTRTVVGRTELRLTQQDLAKLLGATREATARALGDLRREGVISTSRSCITIDDELALTRMTRG